MKSINEQITASLNEAREEVYSVQFIGFDETVKVSVPKEYAKDFEKFLNNEIHNIFSHAEGYTNDFEVED